MLHNFDNFYVSHGINFKQFKYSGMAVLYKEVRICVCDKRGKRDRKLSAS